MKVLFIDYIYFTNIVLLRVFKVYYSVLKLFSKLVNYYYTVIHISNVQISKKK